MIILDEEANGATKSFRYEGLTLRHPQAAHTRFSLPDYHTSEAEHRKALAPPKPPWIDPRIWKATLYALVIYVFLTLTIVVPITVIKSRHHAPTQKFWDLGDSNSLWDSIEDAFPPAVPHHPSPGTLAVDFYRSCNFWSSGSSNNTATARFSLPAVGLIAIRSNATYDPKYLNTIDGQLSVQMNTDSSETSVLFTVDMTYSSSRLRNQINVCFTPSGASRGLSIYVPTYLGDNDKLGFKINVLLPQVTSAIDAFVTYLPMLSQHFGDLTGTSFYVSRFNVEGAARPITCESLHAPQISIKNLAAAISGTFNATNSIALDTIRGPITTNVTLTSYGSVQPTVLNIDTGDSSLDATIVLNFLDLSSDISPSHPRHPAFAAQVRNFNGPLNLNVTYQKPTLQGTLQMRVQNNLAPSVVTLDTVYQGAFSAQSKLDLVTVKGSPVSPRDDPIGANRSRTLEYGQSPDGRVTGWAGWGVKPMGQRTVQSKVDISSALSPVFLYFEPT